MNPYDMFDIIVAAIWFSCGALAAPYSYRWWLRRHGRPEALICAFVTFVVPPSIVYELTH